MAARALLLCALAAALAGGALLAPAAGARRHPKRIVHVGDDYFSPAKLTKAKKVKRETTIVWRWRADNAETHDVLLVKGPKHVHHFHSAPAASGYSFRRTLSKPGIYHMVCTFHATMKQTIVVAR